MEFKQLEAFVNVVKYKSFSKAAEATFLTQPTVSAHVSSLEKELGVVLIDRLGREARTTKEGRLFYKYAIDILNTRDKANLALKSEKNNISGTIEIQASSIPGQYLLPKLMAGFRRDHELVNFDLEQSDSRNVISNIASQTGELGFTGYYGNCGLAYDFLCRDKSVVITPETPKYLELWKQKSQLDIIDIADESFIWREEGSATRKTLEDKCAVKGIRIKSVATINSIEAIKMSVAQGLGISVLSEMAADIHSENRGYLIFNIGDSTLDREFYMTYQKNVCLSPAASAFRKYVLETMQG